MPMLLLRMLGERFPFNEIFWTAAMLGLCPAPSNRNSYLDP